MAHPTLRVVANNDILTDLVNHHCTLAWSISDVNLAARFAITGSINIEIISNKNPGLMITGVVPNRADFILLTTQAISDAVHGGGPPRKIIYYIGGVIVPKTPLNMVGSTRWH